MQNAVQAGVTAEKTPKRAGGGDPTFSAFSRPKSAWGLPPCGTVNRAGYFFHGDRAFGKRQIYRGGTPCRSLRKHQGP
jgi:hypothetical protein